MKYNHKRILRNRLLLIETHLRAIINAFELNTKNNNNYSEANSTFILYSIIDIVDLEKRRHILRTINFMLDEIAQMKEKFALEPEEKSMKRDILGHLIEIWTTLDDSRPEKMAPGF